MTHSILPKEDWLRRHGVDADWPVWGLPQCFHADNGPGFRAGDIESSCLKHGISIEFRPVKVPEYGAHIECLIGTFMRKLKGIAGSTFSSIAGRGEQDAEKYPAMTRRRVRTVAADPDLQTLPPPETSHVRDHSAHPVAPRAPEPVNDTETAAVQTW